MSSELRYPQWQGPLAEATLELDPRRMLEKLQRAEEILMLRLQALAGDASDEDELRALHDGLSLIRSMREEGQAHRKAQGI